MPDAGNKKCCCVNKNAIIELKRGHKNTIIMKYFDERFDEPNHHHTLDFKIDRA